MKRLMCAVLLLALFLTSCGGEMVPPPPEEPEASLAETAPPEPPEEPKTQEELEEDALQALLGRMTLEQKAGQLFFAHCPVGNAVEDVRSYHLGGYILFGRDTKNKTANEIIQAIASYQEAAGEIPLLIGVDEEGGTVVRVSSNPHLRSEKFSSPGRIWKRGEDTESSLLAVERETHEKDLLLKALGFNVNLNPVADISTDSGDFMYDRTTGKDADTTAAYAARVVEVQSRDGMGSVLKHFPGYGGNRDTHTGAAVDDRPLETFWGQDFLPFQRGIAAGEASGLPPAVLVSHNVVNNIDRNLPASLSPEVHLILRNALNFDGVIVTDDMSMGALAGYTDGGGEAVMALQAGNDLLITADYQSQIFKVIEAVKDGTLEESVIDAACLRVLRWKLELGLLELTEEGTLESGLLPRG